MKFFTNHVAQELGFLNSNDEPPMNLFTHLHTGQTIAFDGELMGFTHMNSIPVIHDPIYIDMGTYIYFNPAPVIVPAPSIAIIIVFIVVALATRRSMI